MSLPIGSIIMWNRPASEVPLGWQVCNGTNGTPDLRDYFVKGASVDGDVGVAEDGSHYHSRPANTGGGGGHTHAASVGVGGTSGSTNSIASTAWETGNAVAPGGHSHGNTAHTTSNPGDHTHSLGGNTAAAVVEPLHIKLYYIMRIV